MEDGENRMRQERNERERDGGKKGGREGRRERIANKRWRKGMRNK